MRIFKIRIYFQTRIRSYEIRRAYGVPFFVYRKIMGLAAIILLFICFGFLGLSRIRLFHGASALASVPVTKIEEKVRSFRAEPPALFPYAVLVNKTQKNLTVFGTDGNIWEQRAQYPIVIGEREGRKETQGDKRTPEGLYWIVGERYQDELDTTVYGSHAYVLNYPNRFDIKEGRSGYGIWIHGTDRPVSRGCVTLQKDDLIAFQQYAQRGVPVLITSTPEGKDFKEISSDYNLAAERDSAMASRVRLEESVYDFLREWKKDWNATNIVRYRNHYSADRFTSKGMEYDEWARRKEGIFSNMNGKIRVEIRDFISPWLSSDSAVVRFRQIYRDPSQFSNIPKTLSLARENGIWKIVSEETR